MKIGNYEWPVNGDSFFISCHNDQTLQTKTHYHCQEVSPMAYPWSTMFFNETWDDISLELEHNLNKRRLIVKTLVYQ